MNPTISRLALRALVGQRRGLVLVTLPVLLVLLAAVVRMLTGEPISARLILVEVGLAVVVPLVALLARTRFFAKGHRLSGLDGERMSRRTPSRAETVPEDA